MAQCIVDAGFEKGSILFPSTTTLGNVEVNNRVTAAFTATVAALGAAGKLGTGSVGPRSSSGPTRPSIAPARGWLFHSPAHVAHRGREVANLKLGRGIRPESQGAPAIGG